MKVNIKQLKCGIQREADLFYIKFQLSAPRNFGCALSVCYSVTDEFQNKLKSFSYSVKMERLISVRIFAAIHVTNIEFNILYIRKIYIFFIKNLTWL